MGRPTSQIQKVAGLPQELPGGAIVVAGFWLRLHCNDGGASRLVVRRRPLRALCQVGVGHDSRPSTDPGPRIRSCRTIAQARGLSCTLEL